MRQRTVLQTRELAQNQFGEAVETWIDGPLLCASFEPLKGGEYWKGQNMPQLAAQIEARIRIRFRKGINPGENRIRHGGIIYDIKSVIHDRRRRETQLMVASSAEHQQDGSTVNV